MSACDVGQRIPRRRRLCSPLFYRNCGAGTDRCAESGVLTRLYVPMFILVYNTRWMETILMEVGYF